MSRLSKQEIEDYRLYITSLYDEYLYKTEKRNVSYGELAYIQDLKLKELRDMEKELIEELESEGE